MASRVTKQPNLTGNEFATAGSPLRVADLDADLDAIFSSITNANVAVGAGIATAKLASDAGIIAAMLAANSVTTPKIVDQNVTGTKLAVGASTPNFATAAFALNTTLAVAPSTLVTLASITTRGASKVLVQGTITGFVTLRQGPAAMIFKVFRGATEVIRWKTGTLFDGNTLVSVTALTFPVLFIDNFGAAFTAAYSVTGEVSAVGATITSVTTDNLNAGSLFAVELA